MAVRTDEIQLKINFITDESKQLAKTLLDTKKYNNEIEGANKRIEKYKKELDKANLSEEKRSELLKKIATEEQVVANNMEKIVAAGKDVANLDLSKVTPAQLTERAKQLERAIRSIPQSHPEFEPLQEQLRAVNGQIAEIKANSKPIQPANNLFSSIQGFALRAVAVIGVVAASVRGLIASLGVSSNLEQVNIAFQTFLGNAAAAKRLVADLRNFETKTPFEADQVFSAAKALLAFGFAQKDIIPTLQKVGTVAAATGKDFNELALIYGKARAEGKIQNDTLGQLAEAGIPIYEELSKVLKVNTDQIRKMAEDGEINFQDLEQAFANLTGEGGRFNGLLERQSESLTGLFSTLSGLFKSKLNDAVGAFLPLIKSATKGLIDFLSVPASEKLEEERQAFNGLAVTVLNANVGSKERTALIRDMQAQYPEYLGSLDAERATNEQLKPLLDTINNAYVVRIALQKTQERIQPLLEQQADVELRLANNRVGFNRALARGAELAGVNVAAYKTEKEQLDAITAALQKRVEGQGFNFFPTDTQKALSTLRQFQSIVGFGLEEQANKTKQVSTAEQERQDVIEQLRKTYGSLVDDIMRGGSAAQSATNNATNNAKDAQKTLEKLVETEIAKVEADEKKKALILEGFRIKGTVSEQFYQEAISELTENALRRRMAVYKQYGQELSEEALRTQNTLLEIEAKKAARLTAPLPQTRSLTPVQQQQNDTARRLGNAAAQRDAGITALDNQLEQTELAALRGRFEQALISEQEYNVKRLELEQQFLQQKLNILNSAAVPQTEAIRQTEQEKFQVEQELGRARLENERRLIQMRQQLEDERRGVVTDAMQFGIQLLGQDEAARKRNASVIKAFEIGQVVIQGIAEIQKIFALWAGIPGGQAIATQQAIRAGIRSAIAVAKIATTKFYRGGDTGPGFGAPDETGHRIAGVVHANEYVVPAWLAKSQEAAPVLGWLENKRLRGYAEGGLVAPDTTPTVATYRAVATASVPGLDMFAGAVSRFERIVAAFPREVKSRVNYLDIEEAATDLNTVRGEAQV